MRHLLDIDVLLAANWQDHPQHARAFAWQAGKELALCPVAELGCLRISSSKKAFNAPKRHARMMLETFIQQRKPARIADDHPALEANAKTSEEVTDPYLAALAERHGCRLATLDERIEHSAVELIRPAVGS